MSMQWFTSARLAGSSSLHDIGCKDGRIQTIEPHMPSRDGNNLEGALVMGALAHWHTHLDKTHIISRVRQTEPGLLGAIKACDNDIQTWTSADIYARANSALEESWRAGCRIVRSHVNWMSINEPLAWGVLAELAEQWRGRIELQRVALLKSELFDNEEASHVIARGIKNRHGMMGAFVHSTNCTPTRIASLVQRAQQFELAMDIHLDEEINPNSVGLAYLLENLNKQNAKLPVSVSHVCALSVKPANERNALIDGIAKAQVEVIALPSTNLYLQDQANPALPLTPTIRGIAPVHELKRAGVTVKLSVDNVQDPFYPWGSYDPIDLMQIAAPSLQLVNCFDEWADATAANRVVVGQPADLTIFSNQSSASWPAGSGARKIIRHGELVNDSIMNNL
jgi:cytosine/creatinine deaminase